MRQFTAKDAVSRGGGTLEVLRRAWQITWTHRALWAFGALPLIPALLYLPLAGYFFLSNDFMNDIPRLLDNPTLIMLILVFLLFTGIVSFLLQAFGRSATTFGVIQLEQGQPVLTMREIFRGGRSSFRRMLSAMLLASLGTLVFLAAFSAGLAVAGFATFGLGALVGQFLFWIATMLVYVVIEQSQTAVVADNIHPADALRRAGELVNENIDIVAPITLVLYVGLGIVSGMTMVPVTAPLLVAVVARFSGDIVDPSLLWITLLCLVAALPFYLLLRAILTVYVRAVHTLIYLRLRRSSKLQPLPRNGEASS